MSSSSPRRVRLVGCQGSVQLAAALSALRTHDEHQPPAGDVENHLAIYHLSSPEGQDQEFADCIRELAETSQRWQRITYLRPAECEALRRTWIKQGWDAACRQLRERLELEHVDELFLNQVISVPGCSIATGFPGAKLLGFGDGIGLNYSRDYFTAPPSGTTQTWSQWLRSLERRFRRFRRGNANPASAPPAGKQEALPAIGPDDQYLLLPNLFDEQLRQCQQVEAHTLAEVFAQFSTISALRDSPDIVRAEAALHAARQAVVLLTSNYAETKRMSLPGEIDSYCQLVREASPAPSTAVIIKPHPRDSREKILAVCARLRRTYAHVLTLDAPVTFYAPLEALVSRWVRTIPRFHQKTTMVCVSSSCLGLEYLYGCRTVLGFGPQRVEAHFAADWRTVRLQHERDLASALNQVRQRSTTQAA
jgi:hypothetical protein